VTRPGARHAKPRLILAAAAALILGAIVLVSGLEPARTYGAFGFDAALLRRKSAAPKPPLKKHLIPFGKKRKREMSKYSKRHYGRAGFRLRKPKQIVEHYAVASSLGQIYNTFRPDHPDSELGELPNTCAHFAVDSRGRIQQFVQLSLRCRHVVGLNDVAIGIEHTGYSDRQVLSDKDQMHSSLKLTKWLRCRYDIRIKNVIGHNESLSSPFHHEKVKSLKHQTHGDFKRKSMNKYRKRLRAAGRC